MKDYLKLAGETIVQIVRDFPKGTLIVAGVLIVVAFLTGAVLF